MECHRCADVINNLQKHYNNKCFSENINICNDLKSDDPYLFCCMHIGKCDYIFRKEAFLTPFIGGCNGEKCDGMVLAVGEAPSGVNNFGLLIGGMFNNVGEKNNSFKVSKSPVHWVRDFVKENYGVIPFFVDAIKCGAHRQKNIKTELLDRRSVNCLRDYLSREIEIINPELILCMGDAAEKYTKDTIKNYCTPGKEYKVAKLRHYNFRFVKKEMKNYASFSALWKDQIRDGTIYLRSGEQA